MNTIVTKKAPAAIGPYSQAVETSNLIFVSGQLPVEPQTGVMEENIKKQTEQSLLNIQAILSERNLSMEHIVKTTVFLQDLKDFADVNAIYSRFFGQTYPARSCVEIARLPKDARVEIEAIAIK